MEMYFQAETKDIIITPLQKCPARILLADCIWKENLEGHKPMLLF